jgi:hypothetical protein
MASASHSWEDDHAWDSDSMGGGASGESDEDYDSVTAEQAGNYFSEFLMSLLFSHTISAKQCCVLAWWAQHAGAIGPAAEFAMAPNAKSTGHYQRKIDHVLRLKEREHVLYELQVPGHAKYNASREVSTIHVIPPHELIIDEVEKNRTLEQSLCAPNQAWQTDDFARHARQSDVPLYPCAFYLDGVVYQKRDSTLGFWLYNVISGVRQLFCVLKKSQICKCGCKGWCTLHVVFSFLRWSLESLLQGVLPSCRHDGSQWLPSDAVRATRAGSAAIMRGLVVFVKGDWAEFSHTLGFPIWAHNIHPCIFCSTPLATMKQTTGFNPMSFPFELFTPDSYNRACASAEFFADVTTEDHRKLLLGVLQYDKRKEPMMPHGRSLIADVPSFGLLLGDRLEPSKSLEDVGQLDTARLPLRLTFWRTTLQTKSKHRNPLFDVSTGVSVASLSIDVLHTLHLGVFKHFVMLVIWHLFDSNYCLPEHMWTRTAEERISLMVLRVRTDLWAFYGVLEKRLRHKITRLTDFTVSMVGENGSRKLKTKAAETRWLLPFTMDMLEKHSVVLGDVGEALRGAGEALVAHWDCIENAGDVLTPPEIQVPRRVITITLPTLMRILNAHLRVSRDHYN